MRSRGFHSRLLNLFCRFRLLGLALLLVGLVSWLAVDLRWTLILYPQIFVYSAAVKKLWNLLRLSFIGQKNSALWIGTATWRLLWPGLVLISPAGRVRISWLLIWLHSLLLFKDISRKLVPRSKSINYYGN